MVFTKVYKKHMIVIPKKIREALDIRVGDLLEIRKESNRLVLLPAKKSEKAVEKTHGIVKWEKSIEEGIDAGYRKMGGESIEIRRR